MTSLESSPRLDPQEHERADQSPHLQIWNSREQGRRSCHILLRPTGHLVCEEKGERLGNTNATPWEPYVNAGDGPYQWAAGTIRCDISTEVSSLGPAGPMQPRMAMNAA